MVLLCFGLSLFVFLIFFGFLNGFAMPLAEAVEFACGCVHGPSLGARVVLRICIY